MAARKRAPSPPPTYEQHVERERGRRTQSLYRQRAREQVGAEFGDQPPPRERSAAELAGRRAGQRTYRTVVLGAGTEGTARTYHRIVLAEFVICVVLVGMSPILTSRQKGAAGAAQNAANAAAAASLAGPLVRLTAVCVVFFVLALMATGARAGKVAAAFGGLVVAGTLLNATDEIGLLARALTPGTRTVPAAPAAAGGGGRVVAA